MLSPHPMLIPTPAVTCPGRFDRLFFLIALASCLASASCSKGTTAEAGGAAGTSGWEWDKDRAAAEVTIRIPRRQLQELMEKRAPPAGGLLRGLASRGAAAQAQLLLADVMNAGHVYLHRCRAAHWKPALQSIPEAAVES